jgi:cytochrome c-type biogenesis protein CcmI
MFWTIIVIMILLVLIILLRPLFLSYDRVTNTASSEKELLQLRLWELETDIANRVIDEQQAVLIRQELEEESRRLDAETSGQGATDNNQLTKNGYRAEIIFIVLLFPLSVTGLYLWLGSPDMGTSSFAQYTSISSIDVQNMIQQLESHLDAHPEDTRGWVVLSHYYLATGKEQEANDILATLSQISISGQQAEEPGDTTDKVIMAKISLAPSLMKDIKPTDTLFIYAQAIDGTPMPIAAIKYEAKELPLQVRLDDELSIRQDRKLSAFDYIILTARISHSGDPTPQSGDLMGRLQQVAVGKTDMVELVIDQKIP